MTRQDQKTRAALVDEYGQLVAELAPLEAEAQAVLARTLEPLREKQQRRAMLEAQLKAFAESEPANEPVQIAGKRFTVLFTPRGNETSIPDMQAVEAALGRDRFLSLCSMTLKALKENVAASLVAALTRQERTGPRKFSIVARSNTKAA